MFYISVNAISLSERALNLRCDAMNYYFTKTFVLLVAIYSFGFVCKIIRCTVQVLLQCSCWQKMAFMSQLSFPACSSGARFHTRTDRQRKKLIDLGKFRLLELFINYINH